MRLLLDLASEQYLVFLCTPVRELVVAKLEAVAASVVLLNDFVMRGKESQAGVKLFHGLSSLFDLCHVVYVLELHGVDG